MKNSPIHQLHWLSKVLLFSTGVIALLLTVIAGLLYNPHLFELLAEDPKTDQAGPVDLEIVDGIHLPTGFVADEGLALVVANCTTCHSAQLVTQNRATREGWLGMIRWMQATQNLWDLGDNEEMIITYLSRNYAPEDVGRRQNLGEIEWYRLEDQP